MTTSLILAGLWLCAANISALLNEADEQIVAGFALVAVGVPLLGILTCEYGPFLGLASLFLGCVELRWPLIRTMRRGNRRQVAARGGATE